MSHRVKQFDYCQKNPFVYPPTRIAWPVRLLTTIIAAVTVLGCDPAPSSPPLPPSPGSATATPAPRYSEKDLPDILVPNSWTKQLSRTPPPTLRAYETSAPVARITIEAVREDESRLNDNINRFRKDIGLSPANMNDNTLDLGLFTDRPSIRLTLKADAKVMVVEMTENSSERWFFKIAGTQEAIDAHIADFNRLIESVFFN